MTRALAADWLAAGRAAIVVEVLRTAGSVPREAGTRMLVADDASAGTIGGGRLEWTALATAREMLRTAEAAPRQRRFALGPSLGQCCGGSVEIGWRRLDAAALADWPAAPPLFRLQLHGAGHVGRAVATLLATLPVEVDWIDGRDGRDGIHRDDGRNGIDRDASPFPLATTLGTPWPPHVRRLAVDAVEAEVAAAAPGAFFLVLTHDHDLDLRIAEAVLRRADAGWFGLIGSASKRARFAQRFERLGLDAASIARMTCPIGIGGIVGKAPEVIAVAVVAQMLQAAAGRTS